jgi:general secretion pathway protein A
MYLDFFGLQEMPFNITPDPRFLFFTRAHQEAMDSLLYGIEERKGFIELIGEVGCGKTTLCRAALGRLADRVQTALILNPLISETQLVRAILTDLGCTPAGQGRLVLIEQLNQYLLERAREGMNVAVIIDEAQNLAPSMMEMVRLLSNLETDQHKLMQIVLAGQPELERRLSHPDLRQLRQRVMVRAALRPLDEDDTNHYVSHRLRVAGASEDVGFDRAAIGLLHREARGIPRVINKICDRAMLAGYATGNRTLGRDEVRRALRELEGML